MLPCADWQIVSDVSKQYIAFIFRVKHSPFLYYVNLIKRHWLFAMSVTIDHSMRRNIPEDLINNAARTSNLALLLYDILRTNSYIICIYSYTEH